jgi:hypothetical protein
MDQYSELRPIFGDGFIPYHFAITVRNPGGKSGQFKQIVTGLKRLKDTVHSDETAPISPQAFQQLLSNRLEVRDVHAEGPYSSIVLPIRMIRSFGNIPATISGVLGTGLVADALQEELVRCGLQLRSHVILDGDSPFELSVRDDFGNQETVRLYPAKRTLYRHTLRLTDEEVASLGGFILTRFNQGRAKLMRKVFDNGGFTSMRINEPTRYVKLDDYLQCLNSTHQVVVSHRGGVLRKLALHLGVTPPTQGWPQRCDSTVYEVVRRLNGSLDTTPTFILILPRETSVFVPRTRPIRIGPPSRYDSRSRAARIQGAFAAIAVSQPGYCFDTDEVWASAANRAIQAAFAGTEGRPSSYPPATFETYSSWCIEG